MNVPSTTPDSKSSIIGDGFSYPEGEINRGPFSLLKTLESWSIEPTLAEQTILEKFDELGLADDYVTHMGPLFGKGEGVYPVLDGILFEYLSYAFLHTDKRFDGLQISKPLATQHIIEGVYSKIGVAFTIPDGLALDRSNLRYIIEYKSAIQINHAKQLRAIQNLLTSLKQRRSSKKFLPELGRRLGRGKLTAYDIQALFVIGPEKIRTMGLGQIIRYFGPDAVFVTNPVRADVARACRTSLLYYWTSLMEAGESDDEIVVPSNTNELE